MKILLTGSNGFLGSHIYEVIKKDYSVITLNKSNSNYNYDLANDNINFEDTFDIIIHNAGRAHTVPKSEQEIQSFYDTNVKGTSNLLDGLSTIKLPRFFVYISSVSVYGLTQGNHIKEDSPLLASDPYGKSKIEAEECVISWCRKNKVLFTILRLPLIAGVNPPGNLGSMIYGIKKGYYFNIAGGESRKSIVLASDIANFIIKASQVGGIYNLTDGYHPTFSELSKHIASQLDRFFIPNMPKWIAKLLAKIGDLTGDFFPLNSNKFIKIISSLTFDDSKARKAFGWAPTPVLLGFKIKPDVK